MDRFLTGLGQDWAMSRLGWVKSGLGQVQLHDSS